MFRVKNNTKPEAFENKFEIVHHHYPTRHSENNFIEPKIYFKATKFAISLRGPRLWNSLKPLIRSQINLIKFIASNKFDNVYSKI